MYKMNLFAITLLMPFVLSAQDSAGKLGFLAGQYKVIGKKVDSKETYTGTIVFTYDEGKNSLNFKRVIKGKITTGTASIETAQIGEGEVLRLRFKDGKKEYEGTFLWRSDLDNYGRMSGHIYLKSGTTQDPGLEAYFISRH